MDSLLAFANQETPRAASVEQVANNSVTYEKQGHVAVISVDGGMYKKDIGGMCSSVASYDQMVRMIDTAENDPSVSTILFRVDTPGGSVAGADEVGDKIFNSTKRTVTLYENIGASGGIWVFSASDELYATETTMLGSIGVIVSYMEDTAESSVKRVSVVSKNAENKDCSLKGNCKDKIQGMLDTYESMFYQRVERNTGFTADMIKSTFNNGDVIFANSAKEAGFIKDIRTFDSLLSELLGASPTASVGNKSNFKSQGADMAQEDSLLGKLQAMLGLQTDKTEVEALSELEMSLQTATTALATTTDALAAAEQKVTEAEKFKTEIFTRLAEAKTLGVSVETAIKMVEAESPEAASKIAIDSKASHGATPQGEAVTPTAPKGSMSLLEYAEKNKIKVG
jgi:ClpP class serine protease